MSRSLAQRHPSRRRSASVAEQQRLFFSGFGPSLPELVWGNAAGAAALLDADASARIESAVRILDRAWLGDPTHGLVEALNTALRGTVIVHSGARSAMPAWCLHNRDGQVSDDPRQIFGERSVDLSSCRLYQLEGADPFAERPVNLATLSFDPDRLMPLFDVLSFAGLHHQLRVVAYDHEARLLGYFGTYLPKEEPPYTVLEHALLHALVPALRRWLFTAQALGVAPFQETGLTAVLEQIQMPAYLQREDGQIVFANAAARQHSTMGVQALRARHSGERRLPIRAGAQHLSLVTFPAPPRASDLRQLPPALRRVAAGLEAGLSDKEIAEKLQIPLATVRTYTARIFSRLGISSRRALIRR